MFRRLHGPLPLSEASLLALRPALNAPVLNVGFLPVGPARAAIVAFGEEWGGIGLAFGIRSNESGQVAVFRNQESIEPDVPVVTALEPILAEAERMGFLFDEDMVAGVDDGTGRGEAMALWGRLMGELELSSPHPVVPAELAARESVRVSEERPLPNPLPPARPTTPSSPPPNAPQASLPSSAAESVEPSSVPAVGEELVLEERIPEFDLGVEGVVVATAASPGISHQTEPLVPPVALPDPAATSAGGGEPKPVMAAQQKLSKFRHADAAMREESDSANAGNKLGRIPLVRVRRERDGSKMPSSLARLLASF